MLPQVFNKRVLAVIPAYNEQEAIASVVRDVLDVVPYVDVLVIDDGSIDNTAVEAWGAGAIVVQHPINLGIGGTVQTGLKFARNMRYDYIIRLDGDGQHNAGDIPALLDVVVSGKADVAVGSRFLNSKTLEMHIPFVRRIGIRFFATEVSLLTRKPATDTTSGFMAMNHRAVQTLATFLPQDYPEVEGRIILHKAGLTAVEVPVCMRERVAGVSSIDSWKSIYYSLKVSVAVLMTAIKDVPLWAEDVRYANPYRTTVNGRSLRSGSFAADHLLDSQTQVT